MAVSNLQQIGSAFQSTVVLPLAGVSDVVRGIGNFFKSLTDISPLSLLLGIVCFVIYLTIRSRAYFNVLRAAYPDAKIQWRRIWGAYMAAYGFNSVVPARGGDVIKVFLVKTSVPGSRYPAIGSSMFVETVFDGMMALPILIYAIAKGAFPNPQDFVNVGSFDLEFVAANPKLTLFVISVIAVAVFTLAAVFSQRAIRFWNDVKVGVTMLTDRRRFAREVVAPMLVAQAFRWAAFWMLLEAFRVGGSLSGAVLVQAINIIAALMPFTPGGAGVQQALMAKVFEGSANGSTVAAYAVGQQIVIAVTALGIGFFALVRIFGFKSFKEVIAEGRRHRQAEKSGVSPDLDELL